jgi:chorismate dehydratase
LQNNGVVPTPADATGAGVGRRVACVSYLNAKPLIDDARGRLSDPANGPAVGVVYDVPSAVGGYVTRGEAAMGLVPVADLIAADAELEAWTVGGIACDGPTLTVRLFCRCPRERVRTVAADGDSHTSVMLAGLLLRRWTGRVPAVTRVRWSGGSPAGVLPEGQARAGDDAAAADALLLIGDKVVTAAPPGWVYPHQVDLGEAWRAWTGLPFVFATWAGRRGEDVEPIARRLAAVRRDNDGRRAELAEAYASEHGWPAELARAYLVEVLRYELGERELAGLARFADEAHRAGLSERGEVPIRAAVGRG